MRNGYPLSTWQGGKPPPLTPFKEMIHLAIASNLLRRLAWIPLFSHYHNMEEQPSDRLIAQRIRNRIMEAVEILADGNEGVRGKWPVEYFESFHDWVPHRGDGAIRANSAISPDEEAVLRQVSSILDDAYDATPGNMSADELIATGWPNRIQPVASKALNLMDARGRFSEEYEEAAPSD